MKKKIVLVVLLACLVLIPATAATQGAAKSKYAIGLNLGTDNGVAFQYKMNDKFDLIANVSFGAVYGYVGGNVGANFKVCSMKWTDGDWNVTVGAQAAIGVVLPKDGNDSAFYLAGVVPVRLNYTFPKAPWSFYVCAAPGVQICPSIGFAMQGGIGAMYLFN